MIVWPFYHAAIRALSVRPSVSRTASTRKQKGTEKPKLVQTFPRKEVIGAPFFILKDQQA